MFGKFNMTFHSKHNNIERGEDKGFREKWPYSVDFPISYFNFYYFLKKESLAEKLKFLIENKSEYEIRLSHPMKHSEWIAAAAWKIIHVHQEAATDMR